MIEVALALGTNLGDRMKQLKSAATYFTRLSPSPLWEQSSVYATAPVGCPPGSPDYYNAVIVLEYSGTPQEFLTLCKAHEKSEGRLIDSASGPRNAPRPIDVDILYFGDLTVDTAHLVIPHPRMHQRRFVLEPLCEVRPDHRLPGQSLSVRRMLAALDSAEPPLTLVTKLW